MHDPLVSVLCGAYRAERFIRTMIGSIQAQTYPNWELVIVDDASDDKQCEVVERCACNDDRIKLLRLPYNRGLAAATNAAFAASKGDFVCHQDADDWSEPQRLERQMAAMVAEAADIVSCLMRFATVTDDGAVYKKHVGGSGCDPVDMVNECIKAGPAKATMLYRRCVWEKVGKMNEGTVSDDCDWVFRILCVEPPFKWSHVHEELYNYRSHDSQHSTQYRGAVWREYHYMKRLYVPIIRDRLRREGLL